MEEQTQQEQQTKQKFAAPDMEMFYFLGDLLFLYGLIK